MPAKTFWRSFSKLPSRRNPSTFDLEHLENSEWHCCLVDEKSVESVSGLDRNMMFHIKGKGVDIENIFGIVSKSIFRKKNESEGIEESGGASNTEYEDSESDSDLYRDMNPEDVPAVWSIGHTAIITEQLMSSLEDIFPGLIFLTSCHAEELELSQQDIKMWKAMDAYCVHPFCDEGEGCNTAILGIDVDAMAHTLSGKYIGPPLDWKKYFRPLSTRLKYFTGSLEDVLYQFQILRSAKIGYHKISSFGSQSNHEFNDVTLKMLDAKYKAPCPVKIVDLGNACWTYKHFTDDIQTRQYRSPEVIIGAKYGTAADMWSLACIVFELLTGDLLFDPHAGKSWDRDEDHLALIAELLGEFSKKTALSGKRSSTYFHKSGDFRHIHHLKVWLLVDVLQDKYLFSPEDALAVSDFLSKLLEVCIM